MIVVLNDGIQIGLHGKICPQELAHGSFVVGMLSSKVSNSSAEGGHGVIICCNVGIHCTSQRMLPINIICWQ